MDRTGWDRFLYTDEDIRSLFEVSDGFNDDVNTNCRVRSEEETFSSFVDKGSTALINEHPWVLEQLL